jgi:glycosyltransferase involved in cell wall biosynthesis
MLRKGGRSVDAGRFHVIHNWVDERFIHPLPKSQNWFVEEHGLQGKFVVLYSGNIGRSQNLETVIAAAERFQDRNAVFLFIGEGGKKAKLEALTRERGLQNVRFLPYQPREVLPFSLTCADVSLVALERGIEGLSMPSKLYAILASGRAVVALVENGYEVARIIENADCGKSVVPNDVEGLASALKSYYDDRDACARDGRKGREYLEAHFSRGRALQEYYDLLQSVQ